MKTPKGSSLKVELAVRLFLIIFFFYTDKYPGFVRIIQKEEYWLYNFPRTADYYPSSYLWSTLIGGPILTVWIVYLFTKDKVDVIQSILAAYLSIFLAGSLVNCIKIGVGRPRPDFLARCFPDGNIDDSMKCTGKPEDVIEGYKSFPSGHSALCFSCLGYIALYLAGKLHIFNPAGRGSAWRVICVIFPLLWATMIAVSRTADYHHHWQDVTVGSILGLVVSYIVYYMYYPPLHRVNSHLPYVSLTPVNTKVTTRDYPISPNEDLHLQSPSTTHSNTSLEQAMKLV
ncbi:Phosphatidate phosphatase ppapdc1b [Mactra antiquata]